MTKQIYNIAIPMSGGFDSTISALLLRRVSDSIFYYSVDYGQPYTEKEKRAIAAIARRYQFDIKRFRVNLLQEDLGSMPTIEDSKIEGRNTLLLYIGAFYGEKVIISAPDGDMHSGMLDKNEKYFDTTGAYFSEVFGRTISISNILGIDTKSGWAMFAKNAWGMDEIQWILENTVSCYDPDHNMCGVCKPCFRKWVQMINVGLIEHRAQSFKYFSNNPIQSQVAKELLSAYDHAYVAGDFSHYSKGRIEETWFALDKVGIKH